MKAKKFKALLVFLLLTGAFSLNAGEKEGWENRGVIKHKRTFILQSIKNRNFRLLVSSRRVEKVEYLKMKSKNSQRIILLSPGNKTILLMLRAGRPKVRAHLVFRDGYELCRGRERPCLAGVVFPAAFHAGGDYFYLEERKNYDKTSDYYLLLKSKPRVYRRYRLRQNRCCGDIRLSPDPAGPLKQKVSIRIDWSESGESVSHFVIGSKHYRADTSYFDMPNKKRSPDEERE